MVGLILLIFLVWLIYLTSAVSDLRRRNGSEHTTQEPLPQIPDIPDMPPIQANAKKKQQTTHTTERKSSSFEESIGTHWFQWLGIGALILALVFFLKWAIDQGIIGPSMRTAIGYIFSAAAIIAGHYLRKTHGNWGLTFTGAGGLAAYIVTWYAQHNYNLFPDNAAFALYIIITITLCVLAGHYKAMGLAIVGIAGGFLTPLLMGTGSTTITLLSYILLLDLGILGICYMQNWRMLDAFALIGTIIWQMVAIGRYDITLATGLTFTTIFAVLYLLIPTVNNIVRGNVSKQEDVVMVVLGGLAHITLFFMWLVNAGILEQYDALVAWIFAGVFAAFGIGVYMRNKEDSPMIYGSIAQAILYFSLAVSLQFGELSTLIIWSLEAAALMWLSVQLNDKRLHYLAWPIMGISYVYYFLNEYYGGPPIFLLQEGMWLFFLWIIFMVGAGIQAVRDDNKEQSTVFSAFCIITAALLGISVLIHLFEMRQSELTFGMRFAEFAALVGGSYVVLWNAKLHWSNLASDMKQGMTYLGIAAQIFTVIYLTREFTYLVHEHYVNTGINPRQLIDVGTTVIWALYGTITLIIGFLQKWRQLRLFSLALLLIAIAKLSLFDLGNLGSGARIAGFTILGILLIGASFLYQRFKSEFKEFLS